MSQKPSETEQVDRVVVIVRQMIDLAQTHIPDELTRSLALAATLVRNDPEGSARGIRSMYGGMGSLNDVVLYRNGQPLIEENIAFSALKSELFDLCVELSAFGQTLSSGDT